jgi:hypothetical protein
MHVYEPADEHAGQVTDSPAYWFCVMESAKASGDFDLAARAKRELERLGVQVTYRAGKPRKEVPGAR